MNYRIFDKDKMSKLNCNQAFSFGCFSFKSDYETGYSAIIQENLAEFCRCSTSTIRKYIDVYKEHKLITKSNQICNVDDNGNFIRRNYYWLYIPDKDNSNYFTVERDYFIQDIPTNILGYVLLVKCICVNGTNDCYYDLKEISSYLNIGYSTLKSKTGIHQQAIKYGLIEDKDVRYNSKQMIRHRIIDPNIRIGEKQNLPDLTTRTGRFEKMNLENYNLIRKFCSELGVKPPPYHKDMMSRIVAYARGEQLYDLFKKRITTVEGGEITSLKYFIATLGLEYIEKKEPDYPPIIF